MAGRLVAAGYGEFRPIALNDTREHRALNRRVEIHLLSSVQSDGRQ
jgi:chemotaxis protein MotB